MILVDTGYWCALANSKDKHHQRALEVTATLHEAPITTWPVMTESCYLLQKKLGTQAASRFIQMIKTSDVEIFTIKKEHLARIHLLMLKYADLPMDLADASLVLLAETLGEGRILSTDQRDFQCYRWKNHNPFQNILLMNA